MSIRVDSSSLILGALVVGNRGLGVLGSQVPSTGTDGPSYLYNDLSLPADADKEIRGEIIAFPSAGKFVANEDGSFIFSDAPDGMYSFQYQLSADGVAVGSSVTSTLTIGSGQPAPAVVAISSIAAALAKFEANGTVDLKGDASGTLNVYIDSIPAGTTLGPFAVTPSGNNWTYQSADLAPGSWKLTAVAVANAAPAASSTSTTLTVVGMSGTPALPL